jgi:hypothetical protein
MLRTIVRAAPEAGQTIRLTYADGKIVAVDLTSIIRQGGVFTALGDPIVFERVRIGERGRYIEWPGGPDLCADALWLAAHSGDEAEAA